MKFSRRAFLWTTAAGGVTAAMYGYCWESKWLDVTHTKVPVAKEGGPPRLRILLLSDLHWSAFDPLDFLRFSFELGGSKGPDLVCLTGDLICVGNEYQLDEYGPTLAFLTEIAPTYAVLGNHDGGRWSRERNGLGDESVMIGLLTDAGLSVLHNRSVQLESKGQIINIVGVPDLWAGGIDPGKAFSEVKDGDDEFTIVMAHNPDSKDLMTDYSWNLMLCGHTHGGQVAFPLVGAPYVPIRDRRFTAGLNQWNDKLVYTTRGVGSLYGARFNCRPEISILDIV